jgi:hypothetical protein
MRLQIHSVITYTSIIVELGSEEIEKLQQEFGSDD